MIQDYKDTSSEVVESISEEKLTPAEDINNIDVTHLPFGAASETIKYVSNGCLVVAVVKIR